MAQIDDNDLEMLEAFLDEELDEVRREQLLRRLSSDQNLSVELESLRREREARVSMFRSLEGGEVAVVERALGEVTRLQRKRESRIVRIRRVIYATAAAACIVIGFLAGWMGAMGGKSTVQAVEPPYRVELHDETGQTLAVQRFDTFEKAREFSQDLEQWQVRQELLLGGRVTRHSDRY
jgi:anti-sigma factor RsiW